MVTKGEICSKLVVPVAFICGLFMEYLVFEFEKTLMLMDVQAFTGFYLMITLFLVSPFLVTGGIIYYLKEDALEAIFVSAIVIPTYLMFFLK